MSTHKAEEQRELHKAPLDVPELGLRAGDWLQYCPATGRCYQLREVGREVAEAVVPGLARPKLALVRGGA